MSHIIQLPSDKELASACSETSEPGEPMFRLAVRMHLAAKVLEAVQMGLTITTKDNALRIIVEELIGLSLSPIYALSNPWLVGSFRLPDGIVTADVSITNVVASAEVKAMASAAGIDPSNN